MGPVLALILALKRRWIFLNIKTVIELILKTWKIAHLEEVRIATGSVMKALKSFSLARANQTSGRSRRKVDGNRVWLLIDLRVNSGLAGMFTVYRKTDLFISYDTIGFELCVGNRWGNPSNCDVVWCVVASVGRGKARSRTRKDEAELHCRTAVNRSGTHCSSQRRGAYCYWICHHVSTKSGDDNFDDDSSYDTFVLLYFSVCDCCISFWETW